MSLELKNVIIMKHWSVTGTGMTRFILHLVYLFTKTLLFVHSHWHTHNARTKQSLVLVDLQLQTQNNRRFSKIARSFLSNALIICAHWNDNNDYVTRESRCYCLPSQLFSSLPNWIRRNSLSSAFSVQHARLQWIKAVLLARLFLLFLQLSFTNFQFT